MSQSAAHFKRSEKLLLPSGLKVEARKPDPARLVMANANNGNVPMPLVTHMNAVANGKVKADKAPAIVLSEADMPALAKFMDLIVRAAMVWPVVVEINPDYEAGQIVMEDLSAEDRKFIYDWAMPHQELSEAHSFRIEQNGHFQPVSDV